MSGLCLVWYSASLFHHVYMPTYRQIGHLEIDWLDLFYWAVEKIYLTKCPVSVRSHPNLLSWARGSFWKSEIKQTKFVLAVLRLRDRVRSLYMQMELRVNLLQDPDFTGFYISHLTPMFLGSRMSETPCIASTTGTQPQISGRKQMEQWGVMNGWKKPHQAKSK